ncbi:hypothetical protein BC830DRAFT_1164676 [Chytriomyces sp. MP71]|nr:hypothetical protein BC830DRAFT_1164676 [Chytriomyces sp. MP71]
MAPRFVFSPFRNAALKEAHREVWTSLPASAATADERPAPLRTDATGATYVRVAGGTAIYTTAAAPNAAPVSIGAHIADFAVRGQETKTVETVIAAADSLRLLNNTTHSVASVVVASSGTPSFAGVEWHPLARGLAAAGVDSSVVLVDFNSATVRSTLNNSTNVQSFAFNAYGSIIATTSKDNVIRLFDVRASLDPSTSTPVHHAGVKPSKVIWLHGSNSGIDNLFLTAGFSKMRDRELALWDSRSLSKPISNQKVDTSTGLLIPMYDPDSGLLFVTGKGDTAIRTYEVSSSGVTQTPNNFILSQTINNACLMSKLAVNVMDCEVARLMVLSGDLQTLIPVSASVMRKNKMDFQTDLFPDTVSDEPVQSGDSWYNGEVALPSKVSLHPRSRGSTATVASVPTATASAPSPISAPAPVSPSLRSQQSSHESLGARPFQPAPVAGRDFYRPSVTASPAVSTSAPLTQIPSTGQLTMTLLSAQTSPKPSPRPSQPLPAHSSFKYVQGTPTSLLYDLKAGNPALPNECRLLDTNATFAAFPVSGGGGRICVYPITQAGRFPSKLPCVVTGSEVTDYALSKRAGANETLYTLSDDGVLRTWAIPPAGISGDEDLATPVASVKVNPGKGGFLLVHPVVQELVCVSSADPRDAALRSFDLRAGKELWRAAHPDSILAGAFSADGAMVVTVCKDKKVRVLDLRTGEELATAEGFEGVKGARVAWLNSTDYFVACGFGRANQRELKVYNSKDLSKVTIVGVEMSPSLITPHVDDSLPIVYLVGKGESYIQIFHIDLADPNSIKAVKAATYTGGQAQMAVSFVPKERCNVKEVEIAKCYRLFSSGIEVVSFKLPRLRKEYFQDDVFPVLRAAQPISVEAWLADGTKRLETRDVDLCPEGMELLSNVKGSLTPPSQVRNSTTVAVGLSEEKKKQAAMEQMKRLAMADDGEMPQDKQEGAADDEWDD